MPDSNQATKISTTQEIKARLPIEKFIAEYLDLKPAGVNLKALCPFHAEQTPSFMVSPERSSWHCFGCDKGGDIFTFLMEQEGLEFKEALKILAKKAGVPLPAYQANTGRARQKDKLFAVNEAAAEFFQKNLSSGAKTAATGVAELKKRQVDDLTRDTFKIGLALDEWEGLAVFLTKRGFSEQEQIAAGLVVARKFPKKGVYDRFRNRLMFPLVDVLGRVVGFTGRALNPAEKMGKYINSPETPIYHKGDFLYGLNLAKAAIRQKNFVVLVEGQMDVISSARVGVKNVVASSGTALTAHQLELLRRYTNNLVLALDVDLAGATATKKGIDLALACGFNVKVAKMPADVDPDDLCREDPAAWGRALKQSQNIIDYYIGQATEGRDLNRVETKKAVGRVVLPEIARLSDKIEQTHYLQKLSGLLKMEESVLREALLGERSASEQSTSERSTSDRPASEFKEAPKQKAAKKISPLARRIARLLAIRINMGSQDFFGEELKGVLKLISQPALKSILLLLSGDKTRQQINNFLEKKYPSLLRQVNKELFILEQTKDEVSSADEAASLIKIIARDSLKKDLAGLHQQTKAGNWQSGSDSKNAADQKKLQSLFTQKTRELAKLEEQI